MKTANERLAEVRLALGFQKKADFAEKVGIERSTYDKMEKGPHKPSADNLEKIAAKFSEVNLNWLLLEQGPMLFLEGSEHIGQLPPPVPSEAKPLREGMPTIPGTATPQQADFVGKLIERLEKELAQAQAREEYLQGLVTELMGKSDDSPEAAGQQLFTSLLAPVKNVPISLAPALTRQARELEYATANTCRHIFVAQWGEGAPQAKAKEVAA